MNHLQWQERRRYGTSYGEWVLGNVLFTGLLASVVTGGVGIVGTGARALQGEHMFDKLNYGDGYTDWSELAIDGLALTTVMVGLCMWHVMDQESRRSIMGIVMPRS